MKESRMRVCLQAKGGSSATGHEDTTPTEYFTFPSYAVQTLYKLFVCVHSLSK